MTTAKTTIRRFLFLILVAACAFPNSGLAQNAETPTTQPAQLEGLELVWKLSTLPNSVAGGVAADSSKGVVYSIGRAQSFTTIAEISAGGKLEREFKYKESRRVVRTARLRKEQALDLLLFQLWGHSLAAVDTNGTPLWTYDNNQGIDDVWAADLDADGLDEVIVGYNGAAGLHVLNGRGKLLWKNQQEGNVWHVCAADLEGDGRPEVITTSAKGKVRVFKGDGTRLPDIEPPTGYYGTLVRPVKLSDSSRSEGILLTGSGKRVAALTAEGKVAWEVELPTSPSGDIAEPAPGKPWLALRSGGQVAVLNTVNGSIIAKATTPTSERGANSYLCWLEVKGQSSPLLILSTPQSIEAYRVLK